jgi:radical S-adenosyl methionine domain-containing protein 2
MVDFVASIEPKRWKVFQMLPIKDVNDGANDLLITENEFCKYVRRNSKVSELGIPLVAETSKDMVDSYLMVAQDGRMVQNSGNVYSLSKETLLTTGVVNSVEQSGWDWNKFVDRGGVYKW